MASKNLLELRHLFGKYLKHAKGMDAMLSQVLSERARNCYLSHYDLFELKLEIDWKKKCCCRGALWMFCLEKFRLR